MKKLSSKRKLLVFVAFQIFCISVIYFFISFMSVSSSIKKSFSTESIHKLEKYKMDYQLYIQNNLSILSDLAADAKIVESVVQEEIDREYLIDLLRGRKHFGENPVYKIFDFEGLLVEQSSNDSSVNVDQQVIGELLAGKRKNYYFQNIIDGKSNFIFLTPIMFRGGVEGILLAVTPSKLNSVFGFLNKLQGGELAVYVNNIQIEKFGELDGEADIFSHRIDLGPSIYLSLRRDTAILAQTQKELTLQMLAIFGLIMFFSMFVFSQFGKEYLVKPQQKLLEQARQTELFLKKQELILETFNMAMWELNTKKMQLAFTDRMYSVLDINKDIDIRDMNNFIGEVENEDKERFQKSLDQSIANNEEFNLEFRLKTQSGDRLYIRGIGAPIYKVNGSSEDVTTMVGFFWDITKEKLADIQNTHRAKLASIGELAAGVGHEINNPLAIAQGYLSMLTRGELKEPIESSDKATRLIGKIETSFDRIGNIVKGLRRFSHADSDENIEFSLIESVDESFQMVKEIYNKSGIDVSFSNELDFDDFYLDGNKGHFQQVIMNLFANARDAVSENNNKYISIRTELTSNDLIIKIIDTGVGIPDDIVDKIFDPFYTTKAVNEGTGIGLALSYNFVKEMGGNLDVESEVGEGATFKIRFPLSILKRIEPVVENQSTEVFGPPIHANVLVADDEEDLRDILRSMLEGFGMSVTTVENGKEAFDLLCRNSNSFDLVISDVKMPEMDGIELAKEVKANDLITNKPKFLFLTGGVNINFASNELKDLSLGYILKPVEDRAFYDTIARVIPEKIQTSLAQAD